MKHRTAKLNSTVASPLAFATAQRDEQTLDMVRAAVAHDQALLAYQPVMLARGPNTVAFQEGLIRILDATGRIIPAAEFITTIENTELGRQIDVLSLKLGLQALKKNPALRLSINMSARSIGYAAWTNTLNRWLKKNPTIAERLILEISEDSAMVVPELVAGFMLEQQLKGVCFALDNFGAGQMALRYFKDFDFDIVKITGQFIKGIASNPDNRLLTKALISIAANFEMLCVAEKVENAEDLAVLATMGVDCVQGYYFAAPTTRPDWLYEPNTARVAG